MVKKSLCLSSYRLQLRTSQNAFKNSVYHMNTYKAAGCTQFPVAEKYLSPTSDLYGFDEVYVILRMCLSWDIISPCFFTEVSLSKARWNATSWCKSSRKIFGIRDAVGRRQHLHILLRQQGNLWLLFTLFTMFTSLICRWMILKKKPSYLE